MFTDADMDRADWRLLQEGAVSLFWKPQVLDAAKDDLKQLGYEILDIECGHGVEHFRAQVSLALRWEEQFGYSPWTGNLDALNSPEGPHAHGTAIAGAVASRYQFMGAAPGARILAIRAFAGTVGFSFAIMKGIEYAVAQQARIINMSFAGPADPAANGLLAMAHDKGLVLIAASGNFGPKSPPQYPGAAPHVIAVSATDASDKLYFAANRGRHVSISAPGVEVRLPAPNGLYQTHSGTSFATGYVSGVAALVIERNPGITADEVKRLLEATAKDLGPRGKEDQFGAGRIDAYQAVVTLEPQATATSPASNSK